MQLQAGAWGCGQWLYGVDKPKLIRFAGAFPPSRCSSSKEASSFTANWNGSPIKDVKMHGTTRVPTDAPTSTT
eukprot:538099-Pyramimonas_sp.AAC.1